MLCTVMETGSHGDQGRSKATLCEKCRDIFVRKQEPEDGALFPHHASLAGLEAAAAAGCSMCHTLLIELGTRVHVSNHAHNEVKWSYTAELGDANVGSYEVTLYYLTYEPGETGDPKPRRDSVSKVHFWIQPQTEVSQETRVLSEGTTSADASLDVGKAWLQLCKQHHQRCRAPWKPSAWVPTRLVDLRAEETNDDILRIIETNSEPVSSEYMTLSHRWGRVTFSMFTESNKDRMKEGFSTEPLPRTFKDAIRVTRRFGVRYLWIDCLCILQGSAEDFEREAALMHKVYGNSLCNICATGARDNQEPLFADRQSNTQGSFRIELGWHSSPRTEYTVYNAELWKHGVFSQPVSRRAWVMQERFLAPCVLHFGKEQLFWECRALHACEQYPSGLPPAITFGAYDLKTIDLAREVDLDMSPETKMYKLWNILLYAYVRCGLTEPSDKFVALAGIAIRVHQTLKDDYIGGLWRSYLMYDLLWQLEDVHVGVSSPAIYRAPSWSWASVEGPLILGGQVPLFEKVRLACTMLEFSSVLASSNLFGPIKSATLRIRAQLKKLSITHPLLTAAPEDWHSLARTGLNCGIKVNGQWIKSMITVFDVAPLAPPTDSLYCFCVREEEQEEDDYYFEELDDDGEATASVGRQDEPHFIPFHFGLIIAPTGHRNGEYRRLAYYSLGGDEVLSIWNAAEGTDEGDWPCEDFDDRKKLHTFTLV